MKMDAHALLTSQGWRGKGHSLHPTSDTTGLSRPLLVSQKINNHGIGKKQHKTSDMWWMNAFDKSLQGLDTSEQGKVVQTITTGGLDMVVKGGGKWVGTSGGLYASFVRGEGLGGTITPDSEESVSVRVSEESSRKKRRREEEESKEERKKRKAAKRTARIPSESKDTPDLESETETKEERRARRAAKKALKVQEPVVQMKEERKARTAAEEALKMEEAAAEEEAEIWMSTRPPKRSRRKKSAGSANIRRNC
jgi:nucleolar protein TMA23